VTIFLSPPDVGPLEREYVLRALDSGWIAPVGPDLDAFERDLATLTGWPGAVAVSSGTAGLHLALLASGVQPGDDVIVSTFTFAASANAVVHAGATPVFVDSDASTWQLSPRLLSEALDEARRHNRLPRAVMVVDLYGQCADYDAIVPLCHRLGVTVIEDAAEAIGSTYGGRPAGALGDIGVFSFNGNKIVTTSGGGMVLTPDPAVAARVRHLATQARMPAVHYEHEEVGFNYRMSNVLAALGRAQLARLPELIGRRLAVNQRYAERFADRAGITLMPVAPHGTWNGWLTCVVFDDAQRRDAALHALPARDIESRPLWKPMHQQPVYRGHARWLNGVSDDLFARGLCLPSGSALTADQVDVIADVVLASVT